MALELEYERDSFDDVEPSLRPAVEQFYEKNPTSGKFVLKAKGVVPSSKLDEFRQTNINALKERDALKANLAKYEGIDPEKYAELLKAAEDAEHTKLTSEGKYKEALDVQAKRIQAEYEKKITPLAKERDEYKEKAEALDRQLSDLLIGNGIVEAALAAGARKGGALKLIKLAASELWQLRDGVPTPVENGVVVTSPKDHNKTLTMAEWVAAFKEENPGLFEQPSGSGAPGGAAGGGGRNSTDLMQLPARQRLAMARRAGAA